MLTGWRCGVLSVGHTSQQLRRSLGKPNILFFRVTYRRKAEGVAESEKKGLG